MQSAGRIGFWGFGEAGQAFAAGWSGLHRMRAHDVKLDDPALAAGILSACQGCGAEPSDVVGMAAADVVFCLVTADQAEVSAQTAAAGLRPGTLWFDGNSCAPDTKRRAAAAIEAAGGRYVDMAIMAPVRALGHRTPVLLSGPHHTDGLAVLDSLGMLARPVGDQVGAASTVKMLRSVMVKGLEALSVECFLAARRAGVETEVIASLQASDPDMDWARRGAYNLERMIAHGARRAAEMQEVAATLRSLGLPDRMARATAEWQAQLAGTLDDPGPDDLGSRADAILSRLP
ncbi:MAG TPA: DUF1932 domain-containing protein [Paracoccaceae bacterium]|nr:DUF1932 domain-containing protein [Paracoccaceae bacterium]